MTTDKPDASQSYLVLKSTTAQNINGDTYTHHEGSVLSVWELSEFIKGKIKEGSSWYRSQFEPLSDQEAEHHRAKATVVEGDHYVDGNVVSPPWGDYVGLHPTEVIDRMKDESDPEKLAQVKAYEKGGMNRQSIMDYVAPVERAPLPGYEGMHIRAVLDKLAVLPQGDVDDVIKYEMAHRRRPAIISFEKESYTTPDPKADDKKVSV